METIKAKKIKDNKEEELFLPWHTLINAANKSKQINIDIFSPKTNWLIHSNSIATFDGKHKYKKCAQIHKAIE